MRAIIHRGSKEIGGSCVELKSQDKSLLIDMGTPLVNPDGTPFDSRKTKRPASDLLKEGILPDIPGLYDDSRCDVAAIILSHAHQDHTGLAAMAHAKTPVYMSKGTKTLLDVSTLFLPDPVSIKSPVVLDQMWKPVEIGPFVVKPHPVDHSAPGAIAIEVEADGHRVFYTGDFRAHGRKHRLHENLIARPPRNIDIMLMEGSSIGREAGEYTYPSEDSVEEGICETIEGAQNISFLFCASQNLDRVVSAYRAALKCGKTLIIDLYAAYILHELRFMSDNLPQYNRDRVCVKFYHHHQKALEKGGQKNFVMSVVRSGKGIKAEAITENASEYLMITRANSLFPKLTKKLPTLEGVKLIWSMWGGYLTGDDPFSRFCKKHGFERDWKHIHTSGHATVPDLAATVEAVSPKRLVPIHTFRPEGYGGFPAPVTQLNDRDEYDLETVVQ